MIKVVVIDDNDVAVNIIKSHFEDSDKICVVNTFKSGDIALKYIEENERDVDLILMDLLIPNIDGVSLLEEFKERNISKKIIVLSAYKDENILKQSMELGISYYISKPFSIYSLEKRIVDLFTRKTIETRRNENVDLEISQILHNLGIPSHIRGYKYIREGVIMIYNNESVSLITKEVYPQIASKYNTTPSRVERAIRHAIEVSWVRGDLALMEELFGFSVSCDRAKPTNSEFMATIADRLKMNNK